MTFIAGELKLLEELGWYEALLIAAHVLGRLYLSRIVDRYVTELWNLSLDSIPRGYGSSPFLKVPRNIGALLDLLEDLLEVSAPFSVHQRWIV